MNILVVDDERDVQLLFKQQFRKEIRNDIMNFASAMRLGADDLLTKPVEFPVLKEKLKAKM